MKVALILVLAHVLMYGRNIQSWRGLAAPIAITAAPAALIVVQPDMGTTILLAVRSILCESVGSPEDLSQEWEALFGGA